jgi:hypothetical protein
VTKIFQIIIIQKKNKSKKPGSLIAFYTAHIQYEIFSKVPEEEEEEEYKITE